MTENNQTPVTPAEDQPTPEAPKSLFDALIAAGHTEHDIRAHLFACACTLTLMRNMGAPPRMATMAIVAVCNEKLGLKSPVLALQVVHAVVQTLRDDEAFRNAVEKTVAERFEVREVEG